MNAVSLEKDVDGFHPTNIGNLAMRGREPLFIPCAPMVCIELLLRSGVEIIGKKAVVIGRSRIAGLPTSLLLQVAYWFFLLPNVSSAIHRCILIYSWWAETQCNSQHCTCIHKEAGTDYLSSRHCGHRCGSSQHGSRPLAKTRSSCG